MLNSPLLCFITRGNPLKETLWACEAVPCWASVLFRAMEMPLWIHCSSYTRDCSNSSIANNDQFTSSSTSSGFWTHSPSLNKKGFNVGDVFSFSFLVFNKGLGQSLKLVFGRVNTRSSTGITSYSYLFIFKIDPWRGLYWPCHFMFVASSEGLLGDSWLQHVAAEWVKCCGFSSSKEEAVGETPGLAEFETAAGCGGVPWEELTDPKKNMLNSHLKDP